jgi:hypothetical protein
MAYLDQYSDDFYSASLGMKFGFSSFAITIDIHLLDLGVDKRMAD